MKAKIKSLLITVGVSVLLGFVLGGFANGYSTRQTSAQKLTKKVVYNNNTAECVVQGIKNGRFSLIPLNTSVFFGAMLYPIMAGLIGYAVVFYYDNYNNLHRTGHEHGKKKLASESDYREFRERFTDRHGDNILYSEKVSMSMDNNKTNRTTNTLVIGGTGTGKTFRYIKPNLAQLNCSRAITDPGAGLHREFAPFLMKNGRMVYLFSVRDFGRSNHFNPLLSVYDSDGNIDFQKVDILVDIYLKNAVASEEGAKSSGDPFWGKAEKALITAMVYYVLENDDIPKEDKCFGTILRKVQDAKPPETMGFGMPAESEFTKEFNEWRSRMTEEGRRVHAPEYYDTFLVAGDKTMSGILVTTAVDLQIFANPAVDRITRWNSRYPDLNIDISELGKVESYLFLDIPQDNQAFAFLVSMIYSQLYGKLYQMGESICKKKWYIERAKGFPVVYYCDTEAEARDFVENVSESDIIELPYVNGTKIYYLVYGKRIWKKSFAKESLEDIVRNIRQYTIRQNTSDDPELPMRVEFMLDEFKNIGKIPNFPTMLSTQRKYRIGAHIIIQDIAQLKDLYPNDTHQTILANVDCTLYLGSSLLDDKKFIKELMGTTTIHTVSGSGKNRTYTPTQVDVVSMDEIEAINMHRNFFNTECFVIVRDFPPFRDKKLNYLKHPNFKKIKSCRFDVEPYFANNKEIRFE